MCDPSNVQAECEPSPLGIRSRSDVRAVVRAIHMADASQVPFLYRTALTEEDALIAGNAVRALGRFLLFSQDAALLGLLEPFGIIELARTGRLALKR